jgi:hypothetical protein
VGHVDPFLVENTTLRQELQSALVGTAVRFGAAVRRFEQRRRRCGHDYFCSRLLDEVCLSRSMLLLLAEEVGQQKGPRRSGGSPAWQPVGRSSA